MRARAVALATLASVSIVGIGWQLGTQPIEASQNLASSGAAEAATTAASAQASADAAAAATAAANSSATTASGPSGSFTGQLLATPGLRRVE